MKSSIPLGWLLATILFALLGNAVLTALFFVGTAIFSFFVISNEYQSIKQFVIRDFVNSIEEDGNEK